MSSISEREAEIISEFELFGEDWEARYEYLIDMGKDLPAIAPELKTEERNIQGFPTPSTGRSKRHRFLSRRHEKRNPRNPSNGYFEVK